MNLGVIYLLAALSKYPYVFGIKGHFDWNKRHVKEYFTKCFPIICNEVLIGVGNMVINITLGRQTEQVIAALAVFRTLEGLMIGFFAGFASASSVLVGASVGAGELRTAYERAKRLVYMCSGFLLLTNILLMIVHKPILMLMSLSGESLRIGTTLLAIFSVVAVIRLGNWIHNDTFRASGEAVFGTVLEIIFMYAMVLPCVLAAGFWLKLPYWALFLCCYIDEPVRYIIIHKYLYSGKWVKPVTEQGLAALPEFRREMENRRLRKKRIPHDN